MPMPTGLRFFLKYFPSLLNISLIATPIYNDTSYSVPSITLYSISAVFSLLCLCSLVLLESCLAGRNGKASRCQPSVL